MSMLSAQADELRAMAESVGLEVPQAATLMMGAADAIDRLDAENARLRDELESVGTAAYLYGRSDLKAENAKLRGLARDMWEGYNDPRCEECHLKDTPTCADCPICAREASVIDRMRELGIEVDE